MARGRRRRSGAKATRACARRGGDGVRDRDRVGDPGGRDAVRRNRRGDAPARPRRRPAHQPRLRSARPRGGPVVRPGRDGRAVRRPRGRPRPLGPQDPRHERGRAPAADRGGVLPRGRRGAPARRDGSPRLAARRLDRPREARHPDGRAARLAGRAQPAGPAAPWPPVPAVDERRRPLAAGAAPAPRPQGATRAARRAPRPLAALRVPVALPRRARPSACARGATGAAVVRRRRPRRARDRALAVVVLAPAERLAGGHAARGVSVPPSAADEEGRHRGRRRLAAGRVPAGERRHSPEGVLRAGRPVLPASRAARRDRHSARERRPVRAPAEREARSLCPARGALRGRGRRRPPRRHRHDRVRARRRDPAGRRADRGRPVRPRLPDGAARRRVDAHGGAGESLASGRRAAAAVRLRERPPPVRGAAGPGRHADRVLAGRRRDRGGDRLVSPALSAERTSAP